MAEVSPNGSSRYQAKSSTSGTTSGSSTRSWCSVPLSAATRRAWFNSVWLSSRKPTENVLTGCALRRDIVATTALESMPPLRNAPTGTSLT